MLLTLDTSSATSCDTFSFTCARQFHSPEVAADRRYQPKHADYFVAAHVASVKLGTQQQVAELVSESFHTRSRVRQLVAELVRQHVASVKALVWYRLSNMK